MDLWKPYWLIYMGALAIVCQLLPPPDSMLAAVSVNNAVRRRNPLQTNRRLDNYYGFKMTLCVRNEEVLRTEEVLRRTNEGSSNY